MAAPKKKGFVPHENVVALAKNRGGNAGTNSGPPYMDADGATNLVHSPLQDKPNCPRRKGARFGLAPDGKE